MDNVADKANQTVTAKSPTDTKEWVKGFLEKYDSDNSTVNNNSQESHDQPETKMTTFEKYQLAEFLIGDDLHKTLDIDKSATHELFVVTNKELKTGRIVRDNAAIKTVLLETLAIKSKSVQKMYPPKFLNDLAAVWLTYRETSEVAVYGGFDRDVMCMGRSSVIPADKLNLNGFPTWEAWLANMVDSESFAAWLYGVASKKYKGRQVLWLHGPHGEDGKTFIQKRIQKWIFPNVTHATSNTGLSGEAGRWAGSAFEGKQLAVWDDCNNRRALFTEMVKMLSAGVDGNIARIEHKGKGEYSAQLETRLWINSNYAPELSKDNFITSRIVYVFLDKLSGVKTEEELNSNLLTELPHFLAYGRLCYEKLCKDDRVIVQNEEAREQISKITEEFYDDKETFFENNLTLQEGGFVYRGDLYKRLESYTKGNEHKARDFYAWLVKEKGAVEGRKNRPGGGNIRGFRGLHLVGRIVTLAN